MSIFVWATCIVSTIPAAFIVGFVMRLFWTAVYVGWCAFGDAMNYLTRDKL